MGYQVINEETGSASPVFKTHDEARKYIETNSVPVWVIYDGDRLVDESAEEATGMKGKLMEIRAEITRLNKAAGETVFNPTATALLDELIEVAA